MNMKSMEILPHNTSSFYDFEHLFKKGDSGCFGGGFTWGSVYLKMGVRQK
jgi:hypothetical protein